MISLDSRSLAYLNERNLASSTPAQMASAAEALKESLVIAFSYGEEVPVGTVHFLMDFYGDNFEDIAEFREFLYDEPSLIGQYLNNGGAATEAMAPLLMSAKFAPIVDEAQLYQNLSTALTNGKARNLPPPATALVFLAEASTVGNPPLTTGTPPVNVTGKSLALDYARSWVQYATRNGLAIKPDLLQAWSAIDGPAAASAIGDILTQHDGWRTASPELMYHYYKVAPANWVTFASKQLLVKADAEEPLTSEDMSKLWALQALDPQVAADVAEHALIPVYNRREDLNAELLEILALGNPTKAAQLTDSQLFNRLQSQNILVTDSEHNRDAITNNVRPKFRVPLDSLANTGGVKLGDWLGTTLDGQYMIPEGYKVTQEDLDRGYVEFTSPNDVANGQHSFSAFSYRRVSGENVYFPANTPLNFQIDTVPLAFVWANNSGFYEVGDGKREGRITFQLDGQIAHGGAVPDYKVTAEGLFPELPFQLSTKDLPVKGVTLNREHGLVEVIFDATALPASDIDIFPPTVSVRLWGIVDLAGNLTNNIQTPKTKLPYLGNAQYPRVIDTPARYSVKQPALTVDHNALAVLQKLDGAKADAWREKFKNGNLYTDAPAAYVRPSRPKYGPPPSSDTTSTSTASGASYVNTVGWQTLLTKTLMESADSAERMIQEQIAETQLKNKALNDLKDVLEALNAMAAKVPTTAAQETLIQNAITDKAERDRLGQAINSAIGKIPGLIVFDSTSGPAFGAGAGQFNDGHVNKSHLTAAIAKIKTQQESLISTAQADQIRLQSASGKYNHFIQLTSEILSRMYKMLEQLAQKMG
ncbi:MAG: hypothetical protein AB7P37_02080 [Ramlibacter sp.]